MAVPYPSNASAPPDVKRRFKGHCLTVWRNTFNSTLDRHQDEGRAFATAETAAKQCKESNVGEKTMTVKFADGSDTIIEGYGVPFGPDLQGERFEADTNRCHDWFPKGGRPILYDHGVHKAIEMTPVGRELSTTPDEIGDFVRGELDKANKYYEAVAELVRKGKVGFSSGAPDHKVKIADDGKIELWPVVEYSLTTTPAFPNKVAYAMKSADVMEHLAAADVEIPASLSETGGDVRLHPRDKGTKVQLDPRFNETVEQEAGAVPDLPERIEAVAADTRAYIDQTRQNAANRTKSGRVLSRANRSRLQQHLDAVEELRKDLRDLLDQTDPERPTKALAAFNDYHRTEAAINGVSLTEVPT